MVPLAGPGIRRRPHAPRAASFAQTASSPASRVPIPSGCDWCPRGSTGNRAGGRESWRTRPRFRRRASWAA